jgi:hypothetical protein
LQGRSEVGQQDDELITADARYGIAVTQFFLQAQRDLNQQMVTDFKPVTVVDTLEVVQIHGADRDLGMAAAALDELPVQLIQQQLSVRQAGQRVVVGHELDLLFRPLALDEVEADLGHPLDQRHVSVVVVHHLVADADHGDDPLST